MDWLTAGFEALGFLGGWSSKEKEEKAQREAMERQYQYDMQKYGLELKYNWELNKYADAQYEYSKQVAAVSWQNYQLALADRATEVAYRQEEDKNRKLEAKTQYNADVQTAFINKFGAKAQAESVIDDTLRVANAKRTDIGTKGDALIGKVVTQQATGLAQGHSKDAAIADAYLKRSEDINKTEDEAKANIVKTVAAFDKIRNDENLKVEQSYRNMAAVFRLQPQPVPNVPTPTPVFTYRQPVAPVGPAPVQGVQYSSGNLGALSSGLQTATSFGNAWNSISNSFSSFGGFSGFDGGNWTDWIKDF